MVDMFLLFLMTVVVELARLKLRELGKAGG